MPSACSREVSPRPSLPKPPPLLKPPANHCCSTRFPNGSATPSSASGRIRESLLQYQVPEWFRDAKFGIWAHWGPQSAAEDGDWYARNMYMQGSEQCKY